MEVAGCEAAQPSSPLKRSRIDLSGSSSSTGPTGGAGSDGSFESGSPILTPRSSKSGSPILMPLPLLRCPEFGPDDDIEELLVSIRRKLPGEFHVGRSRSDHGDYLDDVCAGAAESQGLRRLSGMDGMLDVLEAREEATRLHGSPGEQADVAVPRRQSVEL